MHMTPIPFYCDNIAIDEVESASNLSLFNVKSIKEATRNSSLRSSLYQINDIPGYYHLEIQGGDFVTFRENI